MLLNFLLAIIGIDIKLIMQKNDIG